MFDDTELQDNQQVPAEEVNTIPLSSAEAPVEEVKQPQESSEVKNFRALREKTERIERERDEAIRVIKEMQSRNQPVAQEEEDLNFTIDPDAIAEGKHLSKVDKRIRKLQTELQSYKQRTQEELIEAKIKAAYPDFDKIVNNANIAQLQEQYPELAATIGSSTDLYSKAVSAYTMIKKFGIVQDDPYESDRLRAQANAKKPKSLAALSPSQGDSPLSQANAFAQGLTDDLKKQLHKEMIAAIKSR